MIKKQIFSKVTIATIILVSVASFANSDEKLTSIVNSNPLLSEARNEYHSITGPVNLPDFEIFYKAYVGYKELGNRGKIRNNILSIIDFSRHSSKKRFWIIDMDSKKLLYYTYAAHGRNSGNGMGVASKFSNTPHSLQSSLGFYLTGETYYGKHGLSLNLDGQEKGINDRARQRRVVIHGADYATAEFAKRYGRLGRSYGCPAVPKHLHKPIINTIKDKSVLFIHHPDLHYQKSSEYMKKVVI
jgi:hypothetical protein